MEVSKDLFLTDAREPYLSVTVASRDLASHRLLSGLTDEEIDALRDALNAGVTAVRDVLARAWARQAPEPGATNFGYGT